MFRRHGEPRPGILLLEVALFAAFVTSTTLYVHRVAARALSQWSDRRAIAAMLAGLDGHQGAPVIEARKGRTRVGSPLFGVIRIPRLGVQAAIRDGTDDTTLARAVGRVPGTSDSVQRGNIGLAAHRDTLFAPLERITRGDLVRIETPAGSALYGVTDIKIVNPTAVEVLDTTDRPSVTLVTCYPFSYIGSAPRRFIVRAERLD